MKKSLIVLVLSIVVAGTIFAEFNFSFYGRGVFTPIAISGEDSAVSAATTTYDNSSRPRIGFTLNANNIANTIGMMAVFNWDGRNGDATSLIGENAHIWVKPLGPFEDRGIGDMLKLTIGRFEIDDFRGRIGASEFSSWITPDGSKDEDDVFRRFKANAGAHLTIKPLSWWDSPWNGLAIEGAVGSNISGERAYLNTIGWSAKDVYSAGQFGLGYRLPNIGLARFQLIGNNKKVFLADYPFKTHNEVLNLSEGLSYNQDADIIEAAFLYDGIENLKIELGAKIPLEYNTDLPNYIYYPGVYKNYPLSTGSTAGNDKLIIQNPVSLALGGTFKWRDLDVLARLDMSFGGTIEHEGVRTITIGMGMGILASVGYRFSPFRVGLDVAFNSHQADSVKTGNKTEVIGKRANDQETSERSDFGFAPWVALDMGGGVIKIGVAVMLPSTERWHYSVPTLSGDDGWRPVYSGDPIISFPVSVTYSF